MSVLSFLNNEHREHARTLMTRSIAVLVLALLFFVTGGGISQNERWHIDRVEITGTQAVDSDDVLVHIGELLQGHYYYTYSRSNSYLFPADQIEARILAEFPRIGRVHASRIDDHRIAVDVVERKPFALWCGEVKTPEQVPCYFIDDTGFVFAHAPVFSPGVYLEIYGALIGAGADDAVRGYLSDRTMSWIYEVYKELTQELGGVLSMSVTTDGEYRIVFKDSTLYPNLVGTEVRVKQDIQPKILVKNLAKALQTQFPRGANEAGKEDSRPLYYIDMRFGNKIFFGFEQEENI